MTSMFALTIGEDNPLHLDTIARLADELNFPVEVVAERYASELAALQEGLMQSLP